MWRVQGSKITAEDREKSVELLRDLKVKSDDASTHVQNMIQKVRNGEIKTAKGISFLEVKNHMLLSYLANLMQVMSRKLHGKTLAGEAAIDRLVEIRTVLEKMRPIEQKLKYQIDKLIKTAHTGTVDEKDPLRFHANPGNLESKLEEEESNTESEGEEVGAAKSKVYRPPKLAAVHYDGDETVREKQDRLLQKAKKRALSTSIMKDLQDEYYDGPQEIRDNTDLHRTTADKTGNDRRHYEENYFVRMSVSKKDRNAAKRLRTVSGLDSLTRFGDISALTHGQHDLEQGGDAPRKRKKKISGKGKKKGTRRKRFK